MKKTIAQRFTDNHSEREYLINELAEVKKLLIEKLSPESPLDVQGIAQFLKLSQKTVYKKISAGELPVFKRGGKNYSYPSLLNKWIQGNNIYNLDI